MYYLPGLISTLYVYFSVKKSNLPDEQEPPTCVLHNVILNLAITEVVFMLGWWDDLITVQYFKFSNILLFYLMQDVYFYCVHKYIFHGILWRLHAMHHQCITSYAAWYGHSIEHIVLNIGSVVVPAWLFPTTPFVFMLIIIQQIYTSVNGHSAHSPHSIHHANNNKRFGSIYLIDRLRGSF